MNNKEKATNPPLQQPSGPFINGSAEAIQGQKAGPDAEADRDERFVPT
jgi:hypothetical protein